MSHRQIRATRGPTVAAAAILLICTIGANCYRSAASGAEPTPQPQPPADVLANTPANEAPAPAAKRAAPRSTSGDSVLDELLQRPEVFGRVLPVKEVDRTRDAAESIVMLALVSVPVCAVVLLVLRRLANWWRQRGARQAARRQRQTPGQELRLWKHEMASWARARHLPRH